MDCFAEPVIGRRFAPTRWLAMTAESTTLDQVRRNYRDGVDQQTEPDPASAYKTGGRQHAVAGFDGAGAAFGAADQGARTDLLAGHDGRTAGHRLRPRSRRGTQRRKALRQGGAWLAAQGAGRWRRRTCQRR